jgi:hypothetical protein
LAVGAREGFGRAMGTVLRKLVLSHANSRLASEGLVLVS